MEVRRFTIPLGLLKAERQLMPRLSDIHPDQRNDALGTVGDIYVHVHRRRSNDRRVRANEGLFGHVNTIHLTLTGSAEVRYPVSAYYEDVYLNVTYSDGTEEQYALPLPYPVGTSGPAGPGEIYMSAPGTYMYTENGNTVIFNYNQGPQVPPPWVQQ